MTTNATVVATGSVTITGGKSINHMILGGAVVTKKLSAALSDSNDAVAVNTLTAGQFLVNLRNGGNSLNLTDPFLNTVGNSVGKVSYTGGTGVDQVSVLVGGGRFNVIDEFFAILGAGDDSLTITVGVPKKFKIDGGADSNDHLLSTGERPAVGANLSIKDFETTPD